MKKLKNIFPFLTFDNANFGYCNIAPITKRNEGGTTITYGNISLFLSGDMYPNTDKNFQYAILEQKTTVREYKRKNAYESTFNKQYVSAATRAELIEKLKNLNTDFVFDNNRECWRQPTKGEIKFGEGAIHYRDFNLSEIGYNKQGKLKRWFIAPNDNLRYNTY